MQRCELLFEWSHAFVVGRKQAMVSPRGETHLFSDDAWRGGVVAVPGVHQDACEGS